MEFLASIQVLIIIYALSELSYSILHIHLKYF